MLNVEMNDEERLRPYCLFHGLFSNLDKGMYDRTSPCLTTHTYQPLSVDLAYDRIQILYGEAILSNLRPNKSSCQSTLPLTINPTIV